ncbi:MAG: LysM peptidoglycan-binding domain-containing protein [Planctomycetota bacterium]
MQTFKTIVVVGTLLCVGWGAHNFMNKPIPNQPLDIEDSVWEDMSGDGFVEPPPVDMDPQAELSDTLPQFPSPGTAPPTLTDNGGGLPSLPPAQLPDGKLPALPPLNPLPSPTNGAGGPPASPSPPTSPPVAGGGTTPMAPSVLPNPPQFEPTPEATDQLASANTPTTQDTGGYTGWSNRFEEMWDSVQMKLQSSQYVDALLAASLFYNDQEVTGEQRDRMVTLLDQLAGTVIYSADYHIEPAYVVQPGDTLASVAAAYSVPEALLARINGITPGGMTAGTQLKVLRGPFRGELDVNGRQLTLFLGRYYAGRFSTGIGRDLPAQVGILEVVEKTGARAFVDRRSGQQVNAGAPENPYGMYWIGLRDSQMADDTFLGIHSTGAAVDASDTRGCISVSEQDADDLQAILSSGSTITVLR